jgi:hypothetical protein
MVSVVVPVYDAVLTLAELVHRTAAALAECQAFEILLVDDGSRDGSWERIKELAAADQRVRGLRLSRNYGQTAALCAGMASSRGDILVTIDADLDTRPEDIADLLGAIASGADLANAARSGRKWPRSALSRVFNRRLSHLGLGYSDTGCGMFAMTRPLAMEALEHGELRRGFRLKALVASLSRSMVEVPVEAGPGGPSRHRLGDLVHSALEVEVAYRRGMFSGVAAAAAVIGVLMSLLALGSAIAAAANLVSWILPAWAAVMVGLALLVALVATGFDLVLRSLHHQGSPFYRVAANTCGVDGGAEV